jgi:hypothetical protein
MRGFGARRAFLILGVATLACISDHAKALSQIQCNRPNRNVTIKLRPDDLVKVRQRVRQYADAHHWIYDEHPFKGRRGLIQILSSPAGPHGRLSIVVGSRSGSSEALADLIDDTPCSAPLPPETNSLFRGFLKYVG